jgi:hypothetical protein
VAKSRLQALARVQGKGNTKKSNDVEPENLMWNTPVEYSPVLNLNKDMAVAMQMMELMEEIYEGLPQLDCGSCGAPGCKALAEDIVRGFANETDCMFKLREEVRALALEMMRLESKLPKSFKDDEQ